MFSSSRVMRRIRLQRFRRSILQSAATTRHNVPIEFETMLGSLCGWARSQPWVVEKRAASDDTITMFAVDCPVLSRREPWFAINAIEDDFGELPGICIVLPDCVAGRAILSGLALDSEPMGRNRSITAIELPTTVEELNAMQLLLKTTYCAAFYPSAEV